MKYLLDLKDYYPIDVKAAKAKWDELMNVPNNTWADMNVDRHLKIINDPDFPGTLRVIKLNTLPALLIRILDLQKQS